MSITLINCLEYIIGLSETDCQCFEDDKTGLVNESVSGLYLDELLNLNTVKASEDCTYKDMWTMMDNARKEAIKVFKGDLFGCMVTGANIKRNPYRGIIGDIRRSGAKALNVTKDYAGVRLNAADIIGGIFRLNKIGASFTQTGTVTVAMFNNIDVEPIHVWEVPTSANAVSWLTLPEQVQLSMHNDYGTNMEWYFVYAYPGFAPREMTFSCNTCGGWKPYFDLNRPHFLQTQTDKGRNGWANHVMVAGIEGNDTSDFDSWRTHNSNSYGLLFDVEFLCSPELSLCTGSIDFETNPVAIVMAHTIRFKAASIMIDKMLRSGNVNRYTLLDGGALIENKKQYEADYTNRVVNYLCEEMSSNVERYSDCYTCKDDWGMKLVNNRK